ncbi:MAG: PKD domain-containing protein [Chitinophagales bacterium]
MKKITFTLILGLFSFYYTNAQCTVGTVNQAVWGSPSDFEFGLTADADITDIDTVEIVQGVDTTVYIQYLLPKKQSITSPISGTATVTSVQILGVSGLPLGVSWTSDAPNNTYYPQTYRYGVVSICGETFSAPGVKTVTVQVEGCGTLSGFSACAGESFPLYINVLPGAGSGPIQMSPALSCDSAMVEFNTALSSLDPVLNPVSYSWLFHDGTTATGKPVSKFYDSPGEYPVKMTVTISEFYISNASTIFSGGWFPDIEELTAIQSPEPYLLIDGGNGAVNTGGAGSGNNKSWSGLNISLTSNSIAITAFDEDNGPPFGSADDNLGTINISVPNPSAGISVGASNGNFAANVTLQIQVAETLEYWDTVRILAPTNPNPLTTDNGVVICPGTNTTIDAGAGYDLVKWYDANGEIFGQTSQTLLVTATGSYYAEVVATGSICPNFTDTLDILFDQVSASAIDVTSSNGLYVANPNNYSVQWFANGSGLPVPIPNATSDTLATFNPANAPFTVVFTSVNNCSATSAPFEICTSGTSSASDNTIDLTGGATISHSGFFLKPGNEVAWAVSTEADGPIEDMTALQTAIAAGWVFPSTDATGLSVDCGDLPSGIPAGNYYFTPLSAAALVIDSIIHEPLVDSGCVSDAQLCLALSATPGVLLITDSLVFTSLSGSTANLRDIVPASFQALIPDTINEGLIALLPTVIPGGSLCFGLTDLYGGNPNGTWTISSLNVGTGTLTIDIADIVSTVYADSCPLITVDQVINIPGQTFTINPNSTASISFTLPPLPTNFPTINADCNVFGEASLISVDCGTSINELINTSSLNLYPNPNSGQFTLSFELKEVSDINVEVFDISGRLVLSNSYAASSTFFSENLSLPYNSPAGFYVLRLRVANELVQKHFIIK